MSEGIVLPRVPRGTLLPLASRIERLDAALPQIRAAVEGETNDVALQATIAALFWETFAQASWCGFYRRIDERTLAVGPYQGPMGCLRIDLARGVCGAAARTNEVQLVPNVEKFPGHIACDDSTKSELVVPVANREAYVTAVLDLDSHTLDAFSREEADRIVRFLGEVFGR